MLDFITGILTHLYTDLPADRDVKILVAVIVHIANGYRIALQPPCQFGKKIDCAYY